MTLKNAVAAIGTILVEALQMCYTGKLTITINFSQGFIGDISAVRQEKIRMD